MSFRLRLIVAFALLALLQAGLFTALSDQLIRDGLEGEATARLGLVSRLLPQGAPSRDWPRKPVPASAKPAWQQALQDYATRYELSRAVLLLGTQALDSSGKGPREADDWWAADGLREPEGHGDLRVSGPLFKAEDGWHKVLYLKLDDGAWLRLEAGTPFLGQVAALQKRLLRLSGILVVPALLAGLGLGWLLSRRARALERRLQAPEQGVELKGQDEFARISAQVQRLLDKLAAERERVASLSLGKLRQAHEMARGVAHELRNPLAGLSLTADVFERRRKEGAGEAELNELAARLQAEVGRVEATVARFLEFSRAPEIKPEPLEMHPLLLEAAKGLRPKPEIPDMGGVAFSDRKAVLAILSTLLTNAAESAGEQGRVSAKLGMTADEVVLQVWDSGPRIPGPDRSRIFTPFFTTKPKGLGLGLATAASLADHLGGRLDLLEDDKTFELQLPAHSNSVL